MRSTLLSVLALSLLSCAHRSGPAASSEVQVVDTLPAFIQAFSGQDARKALLAYESENGKLLDAVGSVRGEEDDRFKRLVAERAALLSSVAEFEANAPRELQGVVAQLREQFSRAPKSTVAFVVLREEAPVMRGSDTLAFNARAKAWAAPGARRAAFARELFGALHRERLADSESVGPLALEIWRDGANRLAVRRLVPEATAEQVLGVSAEQLARLKQREALIAKELLAALDSASPEAVTRFFDPAKKDPLLPPGSGPYIAERIYVRLASSTQPLFLPPTEFTALARRELAAMASTR